MDKATSLPSVYRHIWFIILVWICRTCAQVLPLNEANFDGVVNSADIVFVNFYADWCHFSRQLMPVFEDTAKKLVDNKNIILGKVNCEMENNLATRFHVNKYPTLKVFRFGKMARQEYRGIRNVDVFYDYLVDQAKDVIIVFGKEDEMLNSMDKKKRNVILYTDSMIQPHWGFYRAVASHLRDECKFLAVVSNASTGPDPFRKLIIRSEDLPNNQLEYTGALNDLKQMESWITENSVPIVREITFENAEGLTEEGLPFMILFKHPDDKTSLYDFIDIVRSNLTDQRNSINFLHADGLKFAHPLHHLGKTEKDLPLIAIDSFRHMYLFPKYDDLKIPGKLRQFVDDMHSGKLHREFHHGPDPTPESSTTEEIPAAPAHHPHPNVPAQEVFSQEKPTSEPVPSVFKNLKPSSNRYSLKEEL